MSSPPRKRVRSSTEDPNPAPPTMIQEDSGSRSKQRSPSSERRNRRAMKIQGQRSSVNFSPHSSPGRSMAGLLEDEGSSSETETGEFSPANSGIDPEFLRKIKRKSQLTKLDQEVVRLIGQHLCDVGLRTSADVLMKEAGCRLDEPTAATFRHCVMKGDWAGAVNVLKDLGEHLETGATAMTEMKFLLLEQKYLEHLASGNTLDALKVLQLELTPLKHNTARTHELSSYLMLPLGPQAAHRASRLSSPGCPAPGPGPGSQPASRAEVMERLQVYLPPSVMLPPRRLVSLLQQATNRQREHCLYHNRREDDCSSPPESYAMDHTCTKEMFPSDCLQVLSEHCDEVWFCKWSPNGRYLATGSKDYTVLVWELDPVTLTVRQHSALEGHTWGVAYLAWAPDSRRLAVCGPEDCPEVWVWDITTGRVEGKVSHSGEDSLTCCAWSPDGRRLSVGGNRGQFYQTDSHGTVTDSWEGVRVQCLTYRSDGRHILAADTHHRLRSYNFEELSDQKLLQEDHAIMSFTTDATDRYALLNVATQGLHMWDLRSRALVRRFIGIQQGFYTNYSCFGGLGQSFVASGSEDNKVYIYNVSREEPIAILGGHTRTVNCVSWNPVYHQVLASASDDNSIRIWGPASQFRSKQYPLPSTASTSSQSSPSCSHSNGFTM